jgi:hypothetical protein
MTNANTTLASGNDLRTINPITIEDVVPSPIGTFGEARFNDAILVEAEWDDGSKVTDDELEEINKRFHDWVIGFAEESYVPSEEESYLEWDDERWPF